MPAHPMSCFVLFRRTTRSKTPRPRGPTYTSPILPHPQCSLLPAGSRHPATQSWPASVVSVMSGPRAVRHHAARLNLKINGFASRLCFRLAAGADGVRRHDGGDGALDKCDHVHSALGRLVLRASMRMPSLRSGIWRARISGFASPSSAKPRLVRGDKQKCENAAVHILTLNAC